MVIHEAEMARKMTFQCPKDRIDRLARAIVSLRGITPAAKALKVPKKTICAWLDNGQAGVPFDKVVRLSQKGDMPA
jgi:hypothetical protein